MSFPTTRLRRTRLHPRLRDLVRETALTPHDFLLPLFVTAGSERKPIASMPGHDQIPLAELAGEVKEIESLGLPGVLLFGLPSTKDAVGSDAVSDDGIIQQACRVVKDAAPGLLLVTDVCFCEYTDHGHCGPLCEVAGQLSVDNDATLELLGEQAISHANAGADLLAPSGMMDGMIQAMRSALDAAGHTGMPIMSYAAKYASAYYGPFRDAAESAPMQGDRRTYQMDPANGEEALREVALDVAEGADLLMVKPALAYLDIVRRVKDAYPEIPLAAYNVSGEFAMLKAAAANGWVDHDRVMMETLLSMKRAGADVIITYHAKEAARILG